MEIFFINKISKKTLNYIKVLIRRIIIGIIILKIRYLH
jgi:hypothetical protein